MNKKTVALTKEQFDDIITTMKDGFTGFRPNPRVATALVIEANLGIRISDVLQLKLKDIKKDYRKKNIIVKGDIDINKIKKIPGVININQRADDYEIKIENIEASKQVFKEISKNNITKYVLEEPSLNEIFIAKVGETYEK